MTLFSELPLPLPLAEAIAARGYDTATPVQVAVLEERCQGCDLLVSSQTGSGKTLAFGVLLAQALLDQSKSPVAPGPGDKRARKPSGLVIAPTRELANQVRSELAWLFAKTRLQVAAFTGGSDIRRDLKLLGRGAELVVGTPGRLVDLLTRGALTLDTVDVAVLDEADEMLDMGFRDDLEALLGAATARSRTHMFSATLPRPILHLAAHYQRDAVRVDARAEGADGAHTDIEYVAHVVDFDDRLAAVVNVLRMNSDGKAIVFGTTREGVANLHQALARHGFRAVVLSGDRAQGERNRAIAALKDNEAQVLVATNVAARGLDLPEVDLVVHADLPLNAESLTHRSGRTGRAGRKGRSVIIADPAERRKAERLLATAKASFTWSPAPGAEAIAEASRRRLEESLLTAALPDDAEEARGLAHRLLKQHKREELLEILIQRELERCPRGEPIKQVDPKYLARAQRGDRPELPPRRKHSDFERDAVFFRVNLGAKDKAEPGWLLPLICRRGGVTRNEVGAIRVGPSFTEFQIAGDAAQDFALAAARPDPRAPHVAIEACERTGGAGRAPRAAGDYPRRDGGDERAPRAYPRKQGNDERAPRAYPRKDDSAERPPRAYPRRDEGDERPPRAHPPVERAAAPSARGSGRFGGTPYRDKAHPGRAGDTPPRDRGLFRDAPWDKPHPRRFQNPPPPRDTRRRDAAKPGFGSDSDGARPERQHFRSAGKRGPRPTFVPGPKPHWKKPR
jgi:ATP-dependent RNA helicase DeaD